MYDYKSSYWKEPVGSQMF